jgi:anti-sigma regulatory factor (Ser/Thr protein kinase)
MSVPKILLPSQFEGLSLSVVAADVVAQCPDGWPPKIIIDFSNLRFVRPVGVTFLSNLVHWLDSHGTKVEFANVRIDSDPVRFLDDSLFFEQHTGSKLRPSASPRGTTLPLIKIAHKDSHAWLDLKFVPWLADRLAITQASLYIVKACISELFNNIQDHTQLDIGSIFVQHFPKEMRVTISVSDFGLGIPEAVRKKIPNIKDPDAIIQAVQDGFTTKSKPTNKGVGLDYLLRTVVSGNDGQVTIYSQEGIVRFEKRETDIKSYVFHDVGFCPGTTIDISLRTDTIEILPDEREQLQW